MQPIAHNIHKYSRFCGLQKLYMRYVYYEVGMEENMTGKRKAGKSQSGRTAKSTGI